jgi:hypothetical protein
MMTLPRDIVNNDWILGVLLLLLLLLAVLVSAYRTLIYKILMASVSKQHYIGLQREENEIYRKVSMFLNFISFLSIALFFYFILTRTVVDHTTLRNMGISGLVFYFLVLLGTICAIGLQFGVVYLTGWIFKSQANSQEYQFNIFLTYKLLGVFLVPVLFFLAYAPSSNGGLFMNIGLLLLLFVSIKRYVVGFQIGLSISAFPKLYSILYICTLEFLPIAILLKWQGLEFSQKILGI